MNGMFDPVIHEQFQGRECNSYYGNFSLNIQKYGKVCQITIDGTTTADIPAWDGAPNGIFEAIPVGFRPRIHVFFQNFSDVATDHFLFAQTWGSIYSSVAIPAGSSIRASATYLVSDT